MAAGNRQYPGIFPENCRAAKTALRRYVAHKGKSETGGFAVKSRSVRLQEIPGEPADLPPAFYKPGTGGSDRAGNKKSGYGAKHKATRKPGSDL